MEYFIKTQEWEHIFTILKTREDIRTGNEAKLRCFIEAVWFMARGGCQWRLLPRSYGSWRAIHRRFKRWSEKGVWEDLFEKSQIDPDKEAVMLDSTIVRAHACSAGYGKDSQSIESLGRSRGGFTTKIHALVDALGNPLRFTLTAGQRHDITEAPSLTQDVGNTTVIADKGYDSNAFVEELEIQACHIVIPPKRNRLCPRQYDEHIYKERHLIECFFGKIKHFRRIFSRFDKSSRVFLSFLHFVSTFIWLR
jgi:transposase